MPTYDYQCGKCEFEFEREQRITEAPIKTCPKCKSRRAKRLLSAPSFILKGGGWYADGYGSSGQGSGAADSAESANSTDSEKSKSSTGNDSSSDSSGKSSTESSGTSSAESSGKSSGSKKAGNKKSKKSAA